MKTHIIPFLCCGLVACSLSSCKDEEKELAAKENELSNELEEKRKALNDLVQKVDELETADRSEHLIDAELKLETFTRQIDFEKSEQAQLAGEEKAFKDQLEMYRSKYPLGGQ